MRNMRKIGCGIWLLFDYYHPKSPKSRFVQCFQWFCNHSEKTNILAKNRITLENTAFYQSMPENSDRRHCSCQALSLCKKARRKLMHLSLRLAFARTDCTPLWHIVYLWGETVETSGLFAAASFLVQLDGCGRGIWTPDLRVMSPTSYRTALSRDINVLKLHYNSIVWRRCQGVFFDDSCILSGQ